jgi:hypothetical protein
MGEETGVPYGTLFRKNRRPSLRRMPRIILPCLLLSLAYTIFFFVKKW